MRGTGRPASVSRVERTEVDGVPVFWQQGPEPLSAGLVFDVGRRDEGFAEGGLTHLVEHLVMASLPRSHVDRNASVGPGTTEFTVTGRPEQVAQTLAGVCAALGDLPLDRLETERRVLAAEAESNGASVVGQLLLIRYGATGLGLLGMVEPALPTLSDEQIRAHVGTWFCRGNATLWLTGPPPPGLRLALPDGVRPPHRPQRRVVDGLLPGQVRYDGPDVAVSLEVPRSELTMTAARLAVDRLQEELRHRGGHSYDVDMVPISVDETTAHLALIADAAVKEVPAVVAAMVRVLRELAADGPTDEELAHDLEGAREHAADPRAVEAEVAQTALDALRGRPEVPPQERLAQAAAVTPADVADLLRTALPSLLVLVPDDAPPVLPDVEELPPLSSLTLSGRELRRRLRSDAPRGARLVVGPEGVMLRLSPQARVTVRYADCVAVGVGELDHRHLDLVDAGGLTLQVCEQDWRGGPELLTEVEAAVAGVPRFVLPDGDDLHG